MSIGPKAAVEAAMRRAHSSVSFTARTSPAPAERPKVAASAVEAAKPLPKPEELPPPSVSETLLTPPGAPEMPPTVVVADTAKPAPGKTGGDVWLRGEMLQPLPEPFRPYPETTPAEGVRPVEGASRPSKTYQPRWWR